MIYNPCLYDYDWDVTIHEVKLCPNYPVWGFIEMCTTMYPFADSMAKPASDPVARCAWHGVIMEERLGEADHLPYWVCPVCQQEYLDRMAQLPKKRKITRFKSWGRDHFVPQYGYRPACDAWRLRWWYHARSLDNHYKTIGLKRGDCRVPIKPGQAFLPLLVNRRWKVKEHA